MREVYSVSERRLFMILVLSISIASVKGLSFSPEDMLFDIRC